MAHPNIRKKAAGAERSRALVFARDEAVLAHIETELTAENLTIQVARSAPDIVAALSTDPPPRPQIFVADFDALDAAEVLQIHAIREAWYGSVLAIGNVSLELQKSLNIERVIAHPLEADTLRKAVRAIGLDRATTRIPTFER